MPEAPSLPMFYAAVPMLKQWPSDPHPFSFQQTRVRLAKFLTSFFLRQLHIFFIASALVKVFLLVVVVVVAGVAVPAALLSLVSSLAAKYLTEIS